MGQAESVRPTSDDERWLARFSAIVGRYLGSAGGVSRDAGAAEFTESIDYAFLRRGAGEADIEVMLWPAWRAVITAADTPDDDARSRLVELLVAIRGRGVLARPGGEECAVWDMRVHADLPVFGALMRETWNFSPPDMPASSWANLNAFAAQLTAGGIDFSLYAIWALRDALEEDSREAPQVLPAAVEWFRLAGPVLASLARTGAADTHRRDQPGTLCRAVGLTGPGFSAGRWSFWKDRLENLSGTGGPIAAKAREGLGFMHTSGQGITG